MVNRFTTLYHIKNSTQLVNISMTRVQAMIESVEAQLGDKAELLHKTDVALAAWSEVGLLVETLTKLLSGADVEETQEFEPLKVVVDEGDCAS